MSCLEAKPEDLRYYLDNLPFKVYCLEFSTKMHFGRYLKELLKTQTKISFSQGNLAI